MNRIIAKLRSNSGESIGETLAALLVSALALMILAGALDSAARVVTNSKNKIMDYYSQDQALVEKGTSTQTIEMTLKDITLGESEPLKNATYNVNCYVNTFSNKTVVSYALEPEED